MNPANVKPGEPYRLQIALVNDGKKAIKISGMTFTVTVNGQKTGNPIAPKVKEVGPSQRVVLEELPGVFPEAANTWVGRSAGHREQGRQPQEPDHLEVAPAGAVHLVHAQQPAVRPVAQAAVADAVAVGVELLADHAPARPGLPPLDLAVAVGVDADGGHAAVLEVLGAIDLAVAVLVDLAARHRCPSRRSTATCRAARRPCASSPPSPTTPASE